MPLHKETSSIVDLLFYQVPTSNDLFKEHDSSSENITEIDNVGDGRITSNKDEDCLAQSNAYDWCNQRLLITSKQCSVLIGQFRDDEQCNMHNYKDYSVRQIGSKHHKRL